MLTRLARAGTRDFARPADSARKNPTRHLQASLPTQQSPAARLSIRSVGKAVVQYMLFHDEAVPTDRIEGTSSFTTDFKPPAAPRDSKGRSLRDFDSQDPDLPLPVQLPHLFPGLSTLPGAVKEYVYQRLWDILNGRGTKKMTPAQADREAILEILPRDEARPTGLLESHSHTSR